MSSHRTSHRAILLGLSGILGGALLLSGCSADEDTPAATTTATATSDTVPTASPFPTGTGAPTTGTATPEGTPTTEATPDGMGEQTAEGAVAVLDQYFSAIGTGDYETAYSLWRNEGEASGQTYEEFVAGFDATASVSWDIGEPGRIDAGAGQRYIEIPVRITARTTDGESQRFEGAYVLHHTADVPGATAEQRLWRIDSAEVSEAE